jgi:hypothetical protein
MISTQWYAFNHGLAFQCHIALVGTKGT